MRHQGFTPSQGMGGMPPIKDDRHGSYGGRSFHPGDQQFIPQQGGTSRTSRQCMSQVPSARGLGRGMHGAGFASRPPALAMQPIDSRPQPTSSSTGSSTEAHVNLAGDGERGDEDEAPREAIGRRSGVGHDATALAQMARTLNPITEKRQRRIARTEAAAAKYNIRHAQKFVDVDQDRSLNMAMRFREHIGYVPEPRQVGPNTLSRDRRSPYSLTLEQFYALPTEQRETLTLQKKQRDNLYIRACKLIMGTADTEEATTDLGKHEIISKSVYEKKSVSGAS